MIKKIVILSSIGILASNVKSGVVNSGLENFLRVKKLWQNLGQPAEPKGKGDNIPKQVFVRD